MGGNLFLVGKFKLNTCNLYKVVKVIMGDNGKRESSILFFFLELNDGKNVIIVNLWESEFC